MKKPWTRGDVFLIQNSDGQFTPGQVLGLETRTLHSAACAFFDQRVATPAGVKALRLDANRCFASLLVTPDCLDDGVWPIVGRQPIALPSRLYPYRWLLATNQLLRLVGLEPSLLTKNRPRPIIRGSDNVASFLDAFYGLRAWDDWFKPDYLDGFLLSPDKKPVALKARLKGAR